ncbi:hypothetical protein [Vulcanisaeta sp. JCM 16159]|uniref:hypothetical protein n=1 Tax=Vulcanisaeta sp. JCM 16159 TaxID=1295371 RepID=UPI0006D04B58|nr:hypothetical protein [Vulcanisaeta sp. JCM 16159]
MRLRGVKEKTLHDRLHYIQRALGITWPRSLRRRGQTLLGNVSASLKSFIKNVLQPRDPGLFAILHNSFKTIKSRSNNKTRLPTIDELRQILQRIESIEAKVYFLNTEQRLV